MKAARREGGQHARPASGMSIGPDRYTQPEGGADDGDRTRTPRRRQIFIPLRLSPPPFGVRGLDCPFAMAPQGYRRRPSSLYTFPVAGAWLGIGRGASARKLSPTLSGSAPRVSPWALNHSSLLRLPVSPRPHGAESRPATDIDQCCADGQGPIAPRGSTGHRHPAVPARRRGSGPRSSRPRTRAAWRPRPPSVRVRRPCGCRPWR